MRDMFRKIFGQNSAKVNVEVLFLIESMDFDNLFEGYLVEKLTVFFAINALSRKKRLEILQNPFFD